MTREECNNKFAHIKENYVNDLILYVPEKKHAIVFDEGSGSQLTSEDYAEGIDAYIMATVVTLDRWDDIGSIVDEGDQMPFFYSTEMVTNEFELIYDWLELFYETVPDFLVLNF